MRLPRETREHLASGKRLGWIALSDHMQVCEALREALGDEGYRRHFCNATVGGGRNALFRPLARGFLALFGNTPASPLRSAPRAWSFIFRGLGVLQLDELSNQRACGSLRNLHPSIRERDTFALGVLGAFDACLKFVDSPGSVVMETRRLHAGVVLYNLVWTDPR